MKQLSRNFKEPVPPSGPAESDLGTCLSGVPTAVVEEGGPGAAPAVAFGSSRRYSVLKGLRDAQYGSVKLVQLEGASPRTLVLKSYHRTLVARRFGRLSKNVIYEDAHSELAIWAQLTSAGGHPNVARLLDIAQNESRIYAVTEYARHGDLFDFLEAHNFVMKLKMVQSFAAQAARGLAFLHRAQVAHRDVSLENLTLGLTHERYPVVRYIDFGLTKRMGFPSAPGYAQLAVLPRSGKVAYMAPEVYAGVPCNPYAADVWSLGVCFFIMLTGRQPYEVPVPSHRQHQHKCHSDSDDAHSPPTAPPLVTMFDYLAAGRVVDVMRASGAHDTTIRRTAGLLAAMLNPDPARRPTMDQVLGHPWISGALVPPDASVAAARQVDPSPAVAAFAASVSVPAVPAMDVPCSTPTNLSDSGSDASMGGAASERKGFPSPTGTTLLATGP